MHGGHTGKSGKSPRVKGPPKYCMQCHYALRGLGQVGRCPECGHSFDLKNSWTFTLDAAPRSLVKKIRRDWPRLIPGLVSLAAGLYLAQNVGFIRTVWVYPFWLVPTTYLLLDALWRILGIPATAVMTCLGGFAISMGIAYLGMFFYSDEMNHWAAILIGILGIVSGILVVRADVNDLRS